MKSTLLLALSLCLLVSHGRGNKVSLRNHISISPGEENESDNSNGDKNLFQEETVLRAAMGPKGPKGFKGPRGFMGPRGVTGEQGPPGRDLENPGDKGDTGPQGPRGVQGRQGPEGPKGETGPKGPTGPDGDDGKDGKDGIDGAKGDKGEMGDTGDQGEPGDDGRDGSDGPKGPKGEPGIKGPAGPKGPKGKRGPKGDPGPSVSPEFLNLVLNTIVHEELNDVVNLIRYEHPDGPNINKSLEIKKESDCFAEYGLFTKMCGQDYANQDCPGGFDCVNALEVFTCCSKVTPSGKFSSSPKSDVSLWKEMENDEKLGAMRRSLLLLKDRCRQIGVKPQILCPVYDFPYALQKEMRSYVKGLESEYKSKEKTEISEIEKNG